MGGTGDLRTTQMRTAQCGQSLKTADRPTDRPTAAPARPTLLRIRNGPMARDGGSEPSARARAGGRRKGRAQSRSDAARGGALGWAAAHDDHDRVVVDPDATGAVPAPPHRRKPKRKPNARLSRRSGEPVSVPNPGCATALTELRALERRCACACAAQRTGSRVRVRTQAARLPRRPPLCAHPNDGRTRN